MELKGSYDRTPFRKNHRLCFVKDFASVRQALNELTNDVSKHIIEFVDKLKMVPEDFKKRLIVEEGSTELRETPRETENYILI